MALVLFQPLLSWCFARGFLILTAYNSITFSTVTYLIFTDFKQKSKPSDVVFDLQYADDSALASHTAS